MKTMLKAVVLLAILLLLSGAAFADQCGCYTINATDLDNPENSCTRDVLICFDFGTNLGALLSPAYNGFPKGIVMVLAMYFDAMNQQMTGAIIVDSVSLKFHGDWLHVVNGELFSTNTTKFCGLSGPHRYELRSQLKPVD
jgi:hypothetical protein